MHMNEFGTEHISTKHSVESRQTNYFPAHVTFRKDHWNGTHVAVCALVLT
jgi:hypothetical protein